MSLDKKARQAIGKYSMLDKGDTVFAGVSGGADSVCMLHFLCGLRDEFQLTVTVAHLNHMLRGAESDRDEAFVKALCQKLNVDFITETADVAKLAAERGISLEEAGREARYAFFSRCCTGENADSGSGDIKPAKVAVAHNLNDSVETMLFNFARGSALRGLCGIPPVRRTDVFTVIRPLILCGRDEIEGYCAENGLEYVTDSSNSSDDFTRNRLRHHVLPQLAGINGMFLRNAVRTLESIREDADYLDSLAAKSLLELEISAGRYSREKYLGLPKPVRFRILTTLLSREEIPADNKRLSRLDSVIHAGTGAEQLADGLYFKVDKRNFFLTQPPGCTEYFCMRVDIPQNSMSYEITVFSDKKLHLLNTDYEYYEENIKYTAKPLKNVLDCDRINGILKVRQRNSAGTIRLAGRGCTKTLKKLFQEAGIPPGERERILVLEDSDGIIWVEGFGAAERAAVSDTSRNVLILDIRLGG